MSTGGGMATATAMDGMLGSTVTNNRGLVALLATTMAGKFHSKFNSNCTLTHRKIN